jgi:apolipoprotein D and lipocalin family protein
MIVALVAAVVTTVPNLDLVRYAGKWYEMARYPNRFQKSCAGDVTAEYVLQSDGRIQVINECRRADGSLNRAEGVARKADPSGPASQLKVRFAPAFLSFISAVWGDYWVIGLADDYSWAVVGDPSRKYLWILSRTPSLSDEAYQRAVDTAVRNGFDAARLVKTARGRASARQFRQAASESAGSGTAVPTCASSPR